MISTERLRGVQRITRKASVVAIAGVLFACAAPHPVNSDRAGTDVETGRISYYALDFQGRRTASGERFDVHAFTAAHRSFPFGTRLRVTNLANGRSVVVRVNDRGPWKSGRILDVSPAAARKLGFLGRGTVRARIVVLR